jgi:tRNA dimethylallyltransferase
MAAEARAACQTEGMAERVIAVLGPTAAGKSELALRLAHELGGEVINADSMQLYAGMDIGTAKLTAAQRQGIPHHLLDIWDVRRTANVAEYQQLARDAIAATAARGRVPILAGGSGLYLRAALDDLNFPGTDPAVRQRLEEELADRGPGELFARLAALDPGAAAGILPSNGRRIVRALEVIEVSGQLFTATLPRYNSLYPVVHLGLRVPRDELDRRIAERTAHMWQAGFVDEVRGLDRAGLREGRTASQALGYGQVLRFLAGEWSEETAHAETIKATRRFARRQESWFRRDPRISWLDAGHPGAGHPGGGHGADLARRALATIGPWDPRSASSPEDSPPKYSSPKDMAPRTTS